MRLCCSTLFMTKGEGSNRHFYEVLLSTCLKKVVLNASMHCFQLIIDLGGGSEYGSEYGGTSGRNSRTAGTLSPSKRFTCHGRRSIKKNRPCNCWSGWLLVVPFSSTVNPVLLRQQWVSTTIFLHEASCFQRSIFIRHYLLPRTRTSGFIQSSISIPQALLQDWKYGCCAIIFKKIIDNRQNSSCKVMLWALRGSAENA